MHGWRKLVRTRQQLEAATDDELFRGMESLYALHTSAHAHLLSFIAAEDSRCDAGQDMVVAVGARLGVPTQTAKRWVETARLLRHLPHLATLYESGTLSYEKLEAVARVATPETDESLAAAAPTMSTGAIRKLANKLEAAKDPEPAHAARYLRYRWSRDGSEFRFSGQLSGDAGDVLAKAIEREMDTMPVVPDGERPSYGQKAADALVNLASANIAEDPDADRATIVVHTDHSLLTSGEGIAESEFGTILHADTVRRLMCDSRVQITAHDSNGGTIGVGRTQRTVPPWLLRQLKKRDHCCSFPGCTNLRLVQAHHVKFWTAGGRTDLDELSLLCRFHHRLVHEGKWRMELIDSGTGETRWFKPDGSPYTGMAPPLDDAIRERFFGPLVPA